MGSVGLTRWPGHGWQLRLRWLWWTRISGSTVWLNVAGHKPLAHLPRWRRWLLHLPSVRWRLWPRPWNFNGPVAGFHAEYDRLRGHRNFLWDLLHEATQGLPEADRVEILDRAEAMLRADTGPPPDDERVVDVGDELELDPDDDVCDCGHVHVAGRLGSCSLFTCPCEVWHRG